MYIRVIVVSFFFLVSISHGHEDITEYTIAHLVLQIEDLATENKEMKHAFDMLKSTTAFEIDHLKDENGSLKERLHIMQLTMDRLADDLKRSIQNQGNKMHEVLTGEVIY